MAEDNEIVIDFETTGLTPVFEVYSQTDGTIETPPTITEVGVTGVFFFLRDTSLKIVWRVDGTNGIKYSGYTHANILTTVEKDDLVQSIWTAAISDFEATGGGIMEWLVRILPGLPQKNTFKDNYSYNPEDQVTVARIRIFDSEANTLAATDGGVGEAGTIFEGNIAIAYDVSDHLDTYRSSGS